MKIARWIFCFPVAMLLSFIAWTLTQKAFEGVASTYGGGVFRCIVGLSPVVVAAAVPAVAFVLFAVALAPSKKRAPAFTFFGLSLLFSGGGMELLQFQDFSHVFWCSALIGEVIGGLIGLGIALKLQTWRAKRPIQAAQPTAMTVTPPARQESRRP